MIGAGYICWYCGRTAGPHNADCPEVLQTHEQRVAYVAHVWNEQYGYSLVFSRLIGMGLLRTEIEEGIELNKAREAERRTWQIKYGSPEYGGWRTDPADGRHKPEQVIGAKESNRNLMVATALDILQKESML